VCSLLPFLGSVSGRSGRLLLRLPLRLGSRGRICSRLLLPRLLQRALRVFCIGQGGYVRAGYAVTEDLLLSAKIAVRRGDVVSTSSETAQVIGAATAIAEDPTFGDDLYDYRLRGTTRMAVVSMSWAVDSRSSLNLSYTGESTSIAAGLDYRSHAASLTYSYRY